jgi:SOS-response transcriptional repressor LexA
MHQIQEKLLKIIEEQNVGSLTLRAIGEKIQIKNQPQKIKHHLSQLERKGFIIVDRTNNSIKRAFNKSDSNNLFYSIPLLGSANCGPATLYADENIEGYLKISKKLLPRQKGIFAIRASGNSLNRASIKNKTIESGDYVIIDSQQISPRDEDYVLAIIDQMATIKKFRLDNENNRIVLVSESSQLIHPIFVHPDDNFLINGKVIDVIKKFE